MRWLMERYFGKRLHAQTERHVAALAQSPARAARRRADELLHELGRAAGSPLPFGRTAWDAPVRLPETDVQNAFGVITGGTGSGKTRAALLLAKSLLARLPAERLGLGVVDPKGDLFLGMLFLIGERMKDLDAAEVEALRRRVTVIDFSATDPVSGYNLAAPWPGADPDFFAASRGDLLDALLPGDDALSLGGGLLLRKAIRLLAACRKPLTALEELLHDDAARARLIACADDPDAAAYFARRFPFVPKQTVAAVSRRAEALFSSASVRLALAGEGAPDFRALQDAGSIVLVNTGGANVSRGVRHLLHALALSDICQSIFARESPETPFLWFLDEAHAGFATQQLRDQMTDLLTMARSFGSHAIFLTQNLDTSVRTPEMLTVLLTNLRWSFSMRGEPGGNAFLKSAVPITGRKLKPQSSPFEARAFFTVSEERSMTLEGLAHLKDREGYLWLRTRTGEALHVTTDDIAIPRGRELLQATSALRSDPTFGMRMSRADYDQRIATRADATPREPKGDFGAALTGTYRRVRGGKP